ncbi:MAG: hypothetical protein CVV23_16435 [Ignavibacteriae bacterium HGW-Ignavibacteriae-2]|jgi:chlorobactene glucosyltransferase|nr:MAG: hypothetical protein CVV23_16435 [Ignavibacteriae bacterium HGW-Ignavibacteriae-2]
MDIFLMLFIIIGLFLLASLSIVIYNNFTAPKIINTSHNLIRTPVLSILISARNNEKDIKDCLSSILSQNYNNYEVLVLDDFSKDNTAEIINQFSDKNKRIKLIEGKKLPKDWLNKNWVRHQLAELSKGDILLFMDTNIRLSENSLNSCLYKMQKKNIDLLTVFPTQVMKSVSEFFVVPIVNWFLLSFVPLRPIFASSNKSIIAASDQFILFERNSYFGTGGYELYKNDRKVEMELARKIKNSEKRILTALGDYSIYGRMFNNYNSAYAGLADQLFKDFKTAKLKFLLILSGIMVLYFLPIPLSCFDFRFIWLVLAIVLNRLLISFLSNQSPLIGIIHPLQMILFFILGIFSMNKSK